MAPFESFAIYFAAVAPPAPPPMTTTLGRAPNEIEGIASEAVEAARTPVKARLEIFDIKFLPFNFYKYPDGTSF